MCRFLNAQKYFILTLILSWGSFSFAANQTSDVSPIYPEKNLPFRVHIKVVNQRDGTPFLLPNGLQSFKYGEYKGKWLLISGRTNGLHGFNDDPNNFPPQDQNYTVYVVDIKKQKVYSRSLNDSKSGLTQDQIDSLSTTAPQSYQINKTIYMTGGYGFRNLVNNFVTFDVLTAINIPGLMDWVIHPDKKTKASDSIRQISDPTFKVAGGRMFQLTQNDPTLLVFGQDFEGAYTPNPGSSAIQIYTKEVRRFKILDDGTQLSADILPPSAQDENYRRRDLNVVPYIKHKVRGKGLEFGLINYSGVFTLTGGAWTVPIKITADGKPSMADPNDPATFKQGMNNYNSSFLNLFSRKKGDMYTILFGGITYEEIQRGSLHQDPLLPFTNQVTTIKLNKHGKFSQHLMSAKFPHIKSTQSNPGKRLRFGAASVFFPAPDSSKLQLGQKIFSLDNIKKPIVIGYIVGGIQSSLGNTTSMSDSAASPYIFKVILEPKK